MAKKIDALPVPNLVGFEPEFVIRAEPDRVRRVSFRMWEMRKFKELTGKSFLSLDFENLNDLDLDDLLSLAVVSFMRDDPAVSADRLSEIMDMQDFSNLFLVMTPYFKAVDDTQPQDFLAPGGVAR